jgi:hypothetical protein
MNIYTETLNRQKYLTETLESRKPLFLTLPIGTDKMNIIRLS